MSSACLVCGGPLAPPATGRPPTYCSPACRRDGEYERRRLDRQLDDLERYQRNLRLLGTEERQQRRIDGELAAMRGRLRALLAGERAAVSPPSPAGDG
jgi:hypothetical protein